MTDMPEKIWANGLGCYGTTVSDSGDVYIRGDIHTALEAQLSEALKALEPFAKSGELFPDCPIEYDQCIYAPAAGYEYALYGSHLRAAYHTYSKEKNDG